METTITHQSPVPEPAPGLSLGARTLAIFARPAQAWGGLERKGQWWFPLLVVVLVSLVGTALVYERAVLPTQLAEIDRQVESGQLPPEAADQAENFISGPVTMGITAAMILFGVPLITIAYALMPWIAAGFLLGRRFRFRDAFVVTAWAGLVAIPAQLLTYLLAWLNESMSGLHVGFGVLLPVQDPPSKLLTGLGTFLDQGIGPFSLWYVAVMALGAAALSGGKRRPVLLALGAVWLVVMVVWSVLAGAMARGA